jgi:hypothetical protein
MQFFLSSHSHDTYPSDFSLTEAFWINKFFKKLDDGGPESVEEQGLRLLVWRYHNTEKYSKDVSEKSRKGLPRQNNRSTRQ